MVLRILRWLSSVVILIGIWGVLCSLATAQDHQRDASELLPREQGPWMTVSPGLPQGGDQDPGNHVLPLPPPVDRQPGLEEIAPPPGRSFWGNEPSLKRNRPRIGVVLGGGGAAGVCHVGVLRVLEEYGIPVDCIAGTSMGSIVGSLYATGRSAHELEQIVYTFPWDQVLAEPADHAAKYERRKTDDYLFPPAITVGIQDGKANLGSGFVSGQSLTMHLRRLLASANPVNDFDRLPIPFRTVATDLETGEAVVFRGGNLATAVRASMSIPGVFPPVQYGHRLLVDGALRNNVPVDLAREMGADVVIVVRIPPKLKSKGELSSLFSVSSQALTIMSSHADSHQANGLSNLDILIEPQMDGIGPLDFGRAREAVALGAAAARANEFQLRRLAQFIQAQARPESSEVPQSMIAAPPASVGCLMLEAPEAMTVDRIQIANLSSLASDAAVVSRLTVQPGTPFHLDQLERDIERIYGLGTFGNVDYEIGPNEYGETELDILTTPDHRGDTLLTLGVGLEEDFSGDSFYTASASLVRRGLNSLGGETRLFGQLGSRQRVVADWFQPVEATQQCFVRPFLMYEGYIQPIAIRHQKTAEYLLRGYTAGAEAGRTLGDYGVVAAGTFAETANLQLVTGPASLAVPDDYVSLGGVYGSIKFDKLDSYFFPRRGLLVEAR